MDCDLSSLRILLVGEKNHTMQLLRSVLGIAGVVDIVHVDEVRRAIELLSMEGFSAVFCEQGLPLFEETRFAVAARRRASVLNPMIPIFVLKDRASRSDVEKARDVGATDILTIPISPRTIVTKLHAALSKPRPFIVAPEFFGPDRRAQRPVYKGSERRFRAPKKARVDLTHL